MAAVLILGEDTAHAALIDALSRRQLHVMACEKDDLWLADRLDERDAAQVELSWIGDGSGYAIRWVGEEVLDLGRDRPRIRYTTTVRASQLSDAFKVNGMRPSFRGFLENGPAKPEAHLWRRRLFWAFEEHDVQGVVVGCDTDGQKEHLDGLKQAIRVSNLSDCVVLAAPHQDAEAWFVAGFEPKTAEEHTRLATLCTELSFDPCTKPDLLTAKPNNASTGAKRVLRRLLFDENRSRPLTRDELRDAVDRCLSDLDRLEACRGGDTMVSAFLKAIRTVLYPIVKRG